VPTKIVFICHGSLLRSASKKVRRLFGMGKLLSVYLFLLLAGVSAVIGLAIVTIWTWHSTIAGMLGAICLCVSFVLLALARKK
jgi:hypothetical protein